MMANISFHQNNPLHSVVAASSSSKIIHHQSHHHYLSPHLFESTSNATNSTLPSSSSVSSSNTLSTNKPIGTSSVKTINIHPTVNNGTCRTIESSSANSITLFTKRLKNCHPNSTSLLSSATNSVSYTNVSSGSSTLQNGVIDVSDGGSFANNVITLSNVKQSSTGTSANNSNTINVVNGNNILVLNSKLPSKSILLNSIADINSLKLPPDAKPIIIYPKLNNNGGSGALSLANSLISSIPSVNKSSIHSTAITCKNNQVNLINVKDECCSNNLSGSTSNISKKPPKSNIENCSPAENRIKPITTFSDCSKMIYSITNVSPHLPDEIFDTDDEEEDEEDFGDEENQFDSNQKVMNAESKLEFDAIKSTSNGNTPFVKIENDNDDDVMILEEKKCVNKTILYPSNLIGKSLNAQPIQFCNVKLKNAVMCSNGNGTTFRLSSNGATINSSTNTNGNSCTVAVHSFQVSKASSAAAVAESKLVNSYSAPKSVLSTKINANNSAASTITAVLPSSVTGVAKTARLISQPPKHVISHMVKVGNKPVGGGHVVRPTTSCRSTVSKTTSQLQKTVDTKTNTATISSRRETYERKRSQIWRRLLTEILSRKNRLANSRKEKRKRGKFLSNSCQQWLNKNRLKSVQMNDTTVNGADDVELVHKELL